MPSPFEPFTSYPDGKDKTPSGQDKKFPPVPEPATHGAVLLVLSALLLSVLRFRRRMPRFCP